MLLMSWKSFGSELYPCDFNNWGHRTTVYLSFINKLKSHYNYDVLVTVLSIRILSYLILTIALCDNFISFFLVIKILSHRKVNFTRVMYQSNGGTRFLTQVLQYQCSWIKLHAILAKLKHRSAKTLKARKGVFNFEDRRLGIFKNHYKARLIDLESNYRLFLQNNVFFLNY